MEIGELLLILAGSLAVSAFARWRGWPAPLLVVAVALGVSFIPGVPSVELDPEVVLTVILPPLLFSAALDVSFQNFTQSLRQIRRLGVGLVVVTAVAVGLIAYWLVPALTLPGALLLGAVVAPPDAVSASSIGRKLGLPRRVMTVLSGESLINDAASLTLFKVFVAVIGGSMFNVGGVLWMFVVAIVVGLAVGLVIGLVVQFIRTRITDSVVGTTLGLLVPFAAYAAGEALNGSGVLAVVAAGLYLGYNSPKTGYQTRLQEQPVWGSIDLLLEGFVFALIGLQVSGVVASVAQSPLGLWHSVALAAVVFVVVLLVRPLFIFAAYYRSRSKLLSITAREPHRFSLRRLPGIRRLKHHPGPELSWQELTVISWTGMRGVVTLASAAAVPTMMVSGDFEGRETIILVAFVVTVGTLLLQGLTLPWVIRRLGVIDDAQPERDGEQEVRIFELSVRETKDYIDQHRDEWAKRYGDANLDRSIAVLKRQFERQVTVLLEENNLDQQDIDAPDIDTGDAEKPRLSGPELTELRRELIGYRRSIVLRQRNAGELDEEVMRSVLRGLDAEELALDTSTVTRNRS
ncbi:cation:proton antiporter [Subtercola boreus]|uniref:Sodium:proton antiporter n=1 Tax=Subtercola boreus TaxID=120213 RepID=A0A3E0WA35_9MICO|nr:sodium:proton antiporter [Subtercola boreus]RFA20632.1 sodium:proton antiporter [Subtercola boreus]RFA20746.1 sodium:proton antiporter [Subtercola boreus]RFA26957.1 sodium:proton antiporter [Subtercola boreus]